MQLLPFGFSSVDMGAAAQQLALVAAVYADRRDAVESLLGTDGEILLWVHQRDTWPPSFAVIRGSDGRYFLSIEGTTSAWQAQGHLEGLLGAWWDDDKSMVNARWVSAWEELWSQARAVLPSDLSDARISLCGHSYGGALAQLGGMQLARELSPRQVQVMNFGSPRVRGGGYEGPQPSATWRIRSSQDLVGYLPSEDTALSATLWFLPVQWIQQTIRWQHYGEDVWLGPAGDLGGLAAPPDPLPERVAIGPIGEHSLFNYYGRLLAFRTRYPSSPLMDAPLAVASAVLFGGPLPATTPALPDTFRGPAGEPEKDPVNFFSSSLESETDMAEIGAGLPPGSLRIWKLTHFFASGREGFTESVTYKVTGSGSPLVALSKAGAAYNNMRRKVMSSKVTIDGYRASDENVTGDADFNPAPTLGAGNGLVTGAAAPLQMGWLFRMQAVGGITKANRIFRGFPDALVYSQVEKGKFPVSVPMQVQTFADEVKAFFKGSFTEGEITCTPVIPTKAGSVPDTSPIVDVAGLTLDAEGYLQVATLTDALKAKKGDKVRIHFNRSRWSVGLSGKYVVTLIPTNAGGFTTYTLDKKPRVGSGDLNRLTGKAQLIRPDWATVGFVALQRGAKKDVGRPSFLSVGRARTRNS